MKLLLAAGTFAAATVVTPASAQAVAPQSHGDWVVGCQGDGAARVCNAIQSLQDGQTKVEQVRLVIARQKSTGRFGAVARVPLGFRLDSGLTLKLNDRADGAIGGLIFSRCVAEGCTAEKPLSAAEIATLRSASALDLVFLDFAGKPIVVRMSTRGLREALAAL